MVLSEEGLKGIGKLAAMSIHENWEQPQSGSIAAVEFQTWAKAHSTEEVQQLISYVREFAAAVGVSWKDLDQPPKSAAEHKKREAISCFALSVWRMRQMKDIEPRFTEALDKVAALEDEAFDETKLQALKQRLRHTVGDMATLPSAIPAEVAIEAKSEGPVQAAHDSVDNLET
ncbi:MAG: hypothetical protein JO316_25075 [Abitibacteriaceae bacterium]|nr:hypothetical protein [Abditibacteriaceae bacterium]MBV9868642.1 hypothetical protein [Abditibacteriaceae bacterium]